MSAPQAAGKPLGQVSEDELLIRARAAMARAASLPAGSTGRAIQWAAYDAVTAELNRRAIAWASGASPQVKRELRALLAGPCPGER